MSLRWKLAVGGVGALALAGAGAAVAAGVGHGHGSPGAARAGSQLSDPIGSFGRRSGGVRGVGFGMLGFGRGGELSAAATYLGVSGSDLLTSLRSGKTLAQVADATSGKSAAGLIAALVASAKEKLDAAVTAGKLTQPQEDAAVAKLQQGIAALVNGTPALRGRGPRGGWPGGAPHQSGGGTFGGGANA